MSMLNVLVKRFVRCGKTLDDQVSRAIGKAHFELQLPPPPPES